MEGLRRLDRSRWAWWGVLLVIGVGMLGLNWMTPLLGDDYAYTHSWADWSVITSPLQIPASMLAHSYKMNGRLVSHAFEQLFLIYPKHLFDFCNAAMLVWVLAQCHRICVRPGSRSLLVLLLCGMSFWTFTPAFGHVCLWQDGSVNYLWSLGFGLFFLGPYLKAWLSPEEPGWRVWWKRLLFLPFAFLFGMYSEITSLAVLLMALGLLIACRISRRSGKSWLWLPLLAGAAGYWIMVHLPAELSEKGGSLELGKLLERLGVVWELCLERFLPLLICWGLLMLLACLRRTDPKRRLVSLAFLLGAVASFCVLAAASSLPLRCLCTGSLFLTAANVLLIAELLPGREKLLCLLAAAALCVVFCFSFEAGIRDNFEAHRLWLSQKAAIDHALDTGAGTAVLPQFRAETEYPACFNAKLNTKDPEAWPNKSMAAYYGLDGILGEK